MRRSAKKYGLLLVGLGVAAAVIAPAVVVAQTGDTEDSVTPANTLVTTTSTKTVFVAQVGPATVTQTCTNSSTSGTTPAHGLVMTVKPVSFNDGPGKPCTDSLGGMDTAKTSGVWHVTFLDAANDETTEPPAGASSGDRLSVTVPIKGATVTSSIDPTCLITVAPNAPAHTVGFYNDSNTYNLHNVKVPISLTSTAAPGCPGLAVGSTKDETATFTASYKISPGVHDVS